MFKFKKFLNKQLVYATIILLFIGITIILVWGINQTSIFKDKNSEQNNTSSTISSTNQKANNSTKYTIQTPSAINVLTSSTIQTPITSSSVNIATQQTSSAIQAPAASSSDVTSTSQTPVAIQKSSVTQTSASTPAGINADSEKYSNASKAIFAGPKKMHVSITFDDGYDRTAIKKVLDVLKEENLKATFFVIGKNLNNNTDLWKRAVKEGHEICNHTYYHQLLGKMSDDKIIKEITDWEEAAEKVLGKEYLARMKQDFPFIRLPGGDGNNNKRILYLAQSQGYKVIGWDTDSYTGVIRQMVKDKQPKDAIGKQVSVYIPKAAKKGSIILMHFNAYDTTYLKQTIKGLQDKGYEIKSISEIIKN